MSVIQEQFKALDEQKKLPVFMQCMEQSLVGYTYTDAVRATIDSSFNFSQMEYKLRGYTKDLFGMVSDCYIMYPTCHFRFCSIQALMNFTKGDAIRNPDASVIRESSSAGRMDAIKTRLKWLVETGFILRTNYISKLGDKEKHMNFYTGAKDANSLVCAKLDKSSLVYQDWGFAIPANRIVGHGATVYVSSIFQLSPAFVNYEKGVCRFIVTGTIFLPAEHKYRVGDMSYYVCFHYAFFHRNKDIQTEEEYKVSMINRLEEIYNYLNYRVKSKAIGKESNVIMTVENVEDLKTLEVLLIAKGYDDYSFLKRMYITSASCMEQFGACIQMSIRNGVAEYSVINPPYFNVSLDN